MTGTPPKDMRFALKAGASEKGIKVLIPYPTPSAFSVRADGEVFEPNPFNDALGMPDPVAKTTCGQNRYVGGGNFLEFYISPGCEILIKTRDAIQSSVRMEWTLEEFYADGGTTSFIDRVASVLGIHPSQVLILQVYEGSVVCQYSILDDEEQAEWETKEQTKNNLQNALMSENAKTIFKANVIGAKIDGTMLTGEIPDAPEKPVIDAPPKVFDDLDFASIDTANKSPKDGDDGNNKIKATNSNEWYILGYGGNDELFGNSGDDDLLGGDGKDEITGYGGDDRANGEAGNDTLFGGNGNDQLSGGEGNDKIYGGNDEDRISGGIGEDLLYGGAG